MATPGLLASVSHKLENSASINSASGQPPNGGKAFACIIGGGEKPLFGTSHALSTRYLRQYWNRTQPIIVQADASLVKPKAPPAKAGFVPALAFASRASDPIPQISETSSRQMRHRTRTRPRRERKFPGPNNHYSYRDCRLFGKFPRCFILSGTGNGCGFLP